jgi:hypothetical protein
MGLGPAQGASGGGSLGVDIATGEIQDAAVTLAKMADLAQDQFIGRTTASTGVPETATVTAAARTVLDDTTVAAMVDTLGGAAAQGTGGIVRATSPTLTTPNLGTPSAGVLTSCTGTAAGLTAGTASAVAVGGITGLGTGVGTALAINVGTAGAPVTNGGALGTPSSGTLTSCTGLPATGLSGWEAANGAKMTPFIQSEELTIAAAPTSDTTMTLTAGDFVLAVVCRVTTVIPTAATFDIGVAGATTRFGTGIDVAAGTTNIIPGTQNTNPVTTAAALAIRVTPNAQPADNTGRLRITIMGFRPTAPTS